MDNELSVTAKAVVLEGFQKNKGILSQLSSLEASLKDFITSLRPCAHDYNQRRDLIRIFNEIAKELYGSHRECPVVQEFGSFLMDIFDPKSDLDLSINFSNKKVQSQRDTKINTLRKFGQKLRALQKTGHVTNVQSILSARVPVLKVTDCGSGIECDLSVGNLDGIIKSDIIRLISRIDERFQKLSVLMKAWAKAQDINCSKDGTLNSLSLLLLSLFHLQTRNPPVFPPLSSIFEGGTDPKAVEKIIPRFKNYGMKNKESVAELFVSLLIMLESVETLWPKGLCVSVFEGSWVFKQWNTKKGGEKIAEISIEDFPERSENTARVVTTRKMRKINLCIRRSLQQIRSFVDGNLSTDELMNRLFGIPSKKRKRKQKGKDKGKASKKPHENHRPPFMQQANRTDMSHEITCGAHVEQLTNSQKQANGIERSQITSGTQHGSFSHSSSLDRGLGAPYCLPSGQDLKKPYESYLQSTSFRAGPSRVDTRYSLNGGVHSSDLSHYNHFNQGPTMVQPRAMPCRQGSLERSHEYYHRHPSTSRYQDSMLGMSHEIIKGTESSSSRYVPLERGIDRDLERPPHEYYHSLPSSSSHYRASTLGMPHEIVGSRDSERSGEYYRPLPPPSSSSPYQASSSLSRYSHLNQADYRPVEVYPQHVPQQVYHQHPRSRHLYPPPYRHRDVDVIDQKATRW